MNKLYELRFDCGRMGELYGLFIEEEKKVKKIIGRRVYFGEVLGKYSEICGPINQNEIIERSDDQELIKTLLKVFGSKTISGYNPVVYYDEMETHQEDDV